MMNCQTCRIEIEELEANERLSDEARAHLVVCALCRAFHDERQALKRLIGSLETVAAPADFDFRLRARINAAREAGRSRPSWRSFLASAPALGLAASFALLVAGVVLYKQMKQASPASEQPNVIAQQGPERNTGEAATNSAAAPPPALEGSTPAPPVATNSDEENGARATTVTARNPRPARAVGDKQSARHEPRQVVAANAQPGVSNELSSRPVPLIVPDGASPLNAGNPIVELPVRSASQPMRVFVDDRSGAKRTVTLEPVIFGSQDIAGRNMPRSASSQGIW
jgi:negative regulator of sigma E activity